MNKNILFGIIILLLVVCIAEGFFVFKERNAKLAMMQAVKAASTRVTPPPGRRPMPFMQGQKFSDNPLSAKAYLIFPTSGVLSDDAKKALEGWDLKTTQNSDGSTTIDMIPLKSEYIRQTFTVKSGFKLYFIEATLVDDKPDVDENRGDDTGVLVDQNGIVQ